MTDAQKRQRLERLEALLGLELGDPGEPAGKLPDSEDLAALLDGSLSITRRAQVISHLLVDESLYQEWCLLSEHADLLPDPTPTGAAGGSAAPWWRRMPFWGGGLLTGAVAVTALVVTLGQDPADPVDAFYARHADSLGRSLAGLPEVAVRSPAQPWEEWQFALASGLDEGLARLGYDRDLMDIQRQRLREAGVRYRGGRDPEMDALHEAGRLALAGALVCRAEDRELAETVVRELEPRWSAVTAHTPQLAEALDPDNSLESACLAGDWALQALR